MMWRAQLGEPLYVFKRWNTGCVDLIDEVVKDGTLNIVRHAKLVCEKNHVMLNKIEIVTATACITT